MSTEQNKAVVRRYFAEIWNNGNLDAADELIAPTVANPNAPPGLPPGLECIKHLFTAFRTAFPDIHYTIVDMIAEGDKVAVHWRTRGTHRGDYMGIAPTGKHVTMKGISIYRLADGKIAEIVSSGDDLGLMQQLGAVPVSR